MQVLLLFPTNASNCDHFYANEKSSVIVIQQSLINLYLNQRIFDIRNFLECFSIALFNKRKQYLLFRNNNKNIVSFQQRIYIFYRFISACLCSLVYFFNISYNCFHWKTTFSVYPEKLKYGNEETKLCLWFLNRKSLLHYRHNCISLIVKTL